MRKEGVKKVKRKLNHNKVEIKKTGGGPCQLKEITPLDEVVSRTAGLEATINGVNGKRFGASIIQPNLEILEIESESIMPQEFEIIEVDPLTQIQTVDSAFDTSYENQNGVLEETTNKFDLLKKSIFVNEKLLESFQNVEKFLQNLQEQNTTIIELKKHKLALLKESNLLKKRKLLERSIDNQISYI